jgi:hypothetical protein
VNTSPPLEKTIEARFVKEAKKLGCMVRKLNGMGARDWPDRLVLIPGGAVVLIEFKRPGAELRLSQMDFQDDARAIGHYVQVYQSWEAALAYVKARLV